MTSNAKKCIFSRTSIKFLGHIIDGQRIHPDPGKIAAVEDYQLPTNKKELRQILGMANYLARFVHNYSDILFPPTSMLSNKVTFVWEAPQNADFQKLMKILSSDPVLMIFDPGKETIVTTEDQVANDEVFLCNCTYSRKRIVCRRCIVKIPSESRLKKTPYLVQSGKSANRRNRKHLIPSPDFHTELESEFDVTRYQRAPADVDPGCPSLMPSAQCPKTYSTRFSL
ncbi:hypothetical protein AVEN_218698-1 [Araneus ventricosus]|uniref:RNA-directed DNA polymerase n=1 Tax=Araneus ventricosus TaxID=182803 RepID=A0A4Y2B3Q2_ARAVE|nr:hypothetical protein AVEN_218698-1 [Araneus ventricosus]